MAVAADKRGLKRICPSCGNRYYDFNKRPVTCPECKTEFTSELKTKARRSRVVIEDEKPVKKSADDETDIVIGGDEDVVSLDDVEDMEDADDEDDLDTSDPDLELDPNLEEADDLDDDDSDDEVEEDIEVEVEK